MAAAEIGMDELLTQKIYHKNNLDCIDTNEKTYYNGITKKIKGEIEYWN